MNLIELLNYRFETRLIPIMEEALKTYRSLESQTQADGYKYRIMQIFKAWEDWDIYPKEFIFKCQNTFLGLSINDVILKKMQMSIICIN